MTPVSRRLVVVALAALPAGCSGGILGGGGPAPSLYTLASLRQFPPGLPRLRKQLLIESPTASAALATRRVALRRNRLNIDYFADADWTDSVPSLVQTVLVESFERSNAFVAVAPESLELRADFTLRTEIRHFEADYDAGGTVPRVTVEIRLTLLHSGSGDIVATRTIATAANPAENKVPAIIDAFNVAFGDAVKDIVAWTIETAATSR